MINREKPNSQSDFPHTKASVVSFSAPTTILLLPLPFACHQKAKKNFVPLLLTQVSIGNNTRNYV